MNNPWSIIESGKGLSPEQYRILKVLFWEGLIYHCLDFSLHNNVN
jgi:hypothetical protein